MGIRYRTICLLNILIIFIAPYLLRADGNEGITGDDPALTGTVDQPTSASVSSSDSDLKAKSSTPAENGREPSIAQRVRAEVEEKIKSDSDGTIAAKIYQELLNQQDGKETLEGAGNVPQGELSSLRADTGVDSGTSQVPVRGGSHKLLWSLVSLMVLVLAAALVLVLRLMCREQEYGKDDSQAAGIVPEEEWLGDDDGPAISEVGHPVSFGYEPGETVCFLKKEGPIHEGPPPRRPSASPFPIEMAKGTPSLSGIHPSVFLSHFPPEAHIVFVPVPTPYLPPAPDSGLAGPTGHRV